MKDKKSGGILKFLCVGILFGGAGLCALTFLVVTNPRWFALYWRVVRFFAMLPLSYLRMNQDSA